MFLRIIYYAVQIHLSRRRDYVPTRRGDTLSGKIFLRSSFLTTNNTDEWLLVEAARVMHASPNQADHETNQKSNLNHRKPS